MSRVSIVLAVSVIFLLWETFVRLTSSIGGKTWSDVDIVYEPIPAAISASACVYGLSFNSRILEIQQPIRISTITNEQISVQNQL